MSLFEKRQVAFETKFAHDEELRFKATTRRDALLARWAAEKLGKTGAEVDAYVNEVLDVDLRGEGEQGVFLKVRSDFDAAGVVVSDHKLHIKMDQLLQVAIEAVRSTP